MQANHTRSQALHAAVIMVAALLAAWAAGTLAATAQAASRPPIWETLVSGDGAAYDAATGLAVGSDGSLFSTGYLFFNATGDDISIDRWDDAPDGWATTWNNTGVDMADGGVDIRVRGADDAVYVGGWSSPVGGGADFLLAKYSTAGIPAWVRIWSREAGTWDWLRAVKLDGAGNVIIAGDTNDGIHASLVLAKYSSAGDLLWRRVQRPSGAEYKVNDLCLDAAGRSYVVGRRTRPGHSADAFIASYSSAGVRRWLRTYEPGHGSDSFAAVARAPGGGVYAVGHARGAHGDALITRYSSAGARTLTRRLGAGDGRDQWLNDCAVDSHGRLAVCGGWKRPDADFYVALVRSNGTVVWSHGYDDASLADEAERLVVDSNGRVSAAGTFTSDPGDQQIGTYAFARSGALRWHHRWAGPVAGEKSVRDMARWDSSNVWVCGSADNGASGGDQVYLGWSL